MKRGFYWTKETPAMGSFPPVPAERVKVTGFEMIHGAEWCRVKFEGDGPRDGAIMMHPDRLDLERIEDA